MNLPCTEERGRPRGISRGRDESSSRRYSDEGPRTILRSEKPTLPAAISEELESPSYRFGMRQLRVLYVPFSKVLVRYFHWEPQDGLSRTGNEKAAQKKLAECAKIQNNFRPVFFQHRLLFCTLLQQTPVCSAVHQEFLAQL